MGLTMTDEQIAREALLRRLLKPGDVITSTMCMGCLIEHEFTGWDGHWICGLPTRDTYQLEEMEGPRSDWLENAIGPGNVTHINRNPVEAHEMLAPRPAPYRWRS